MKFIFEVSSKTNLKKSAEQKHKELIDFLKKLESPWGIDSKADIMFPEFKREFTATSTLNKFTGNGIKMNVFYRYRNKLENHDSNDDRIYIEFNTKKVNYEGLVKNIFPQFIKEFDAYRASIFDEKLIFKDFEEKRFGNKRETINRIYPVSFYDSILCKNFFKLTPENIVNLLRNHVYKVEVLNNGIIIIADIKPFTADESIDFEEKIKIILK